MSRDRSWKPKCYNLVKEVKRPVSAKAVEKKMELGNIENPGERNALRAQFMQDFEDEDLLCVLRHKDVGLSRQ